MTPLAHIGSDHWLLALLVYLAPALLILLWVYGGSWLEKLKARRRRSAGT